MLNRRCLLIKHELIRIHTFTQQEGVMGDEVDGCTAHECLLGVHTPCPFSPFLLVLIQFGRTEVIDNTLNPDFVRKYILDYFFEEKQNLRFDV